MEIEKFDVIGMTCAACEANVTKAVSRLDGVSQAEVSLLSNSMKVEFDPQKVSPEKIEQAVSNIGYTAVLQGQKLSQEQGGLSEQWEEKQKKIQAQMNEKKKTLIISIVLLAVLMCFSMLPMLGIFTFLMDMEWMMVSSIIQLVLSMLILFFQRSFFTHGFRALIKRAPNMDSLVAMGSSVSFAYGLYGLLRMAYGYGVMDHEIIHSSMDALYFESAAMIVTLVSLGKYLEARSKAKTSDALGKLADLSPKSAVIEKDGVEMEVEASAVTPGDLVVVRPGQKIPVDGIVASGIGYVDQAAITGESVPVEKQEGDQVMAATININGTFRFTATKVGDDTTLAQVIRLVNEAGNSKAPIARLADKVSGIFVPTVLGIAAITLIGRLIAGYPFEFALSNAVSVLVISCPCALGLATPLAIMVSTGKAAEYGVLIKSASALETLHNVRAIVLDKTGTITSGKPEVVGMELFDETLSPDQFLQAAAAAELGSEHPLGKAVVAKARQERLSIASPDSFEAVSGRGLKAGEGSRTVLAGNRAFMDENHIPVSADEERILKECASKGQTPLLFAFDGRLAGLIAIADTVREDSAAALRELKKMGIRTIMLTGDNAATAQAIASSLDIDQVISDVLPADKESVIRRLQDEGLITAMVGDGINDAPALTRADVGIAIGAGTDIAIESADIVLMKDSLLDVVTAIQLSRATIRNIRENLFWAFFYNVLGIPLAMGLLYPAFGWLLNPMIGAAAMSLSSVTVCLNALRLRFFRPSVYSAKPAPVSAKARDREEEKIEDLPQILNAQAEVEEKQSVLLHVSNMSCAHCVKRVSEALENLPFVDQAIVSLDQEEALVLLRPSAIQRQRDQGFSLIHAKKEWTQQMLEALKEAGYPAAVHPENSTVSRVESSLNDRAEHTAVLEVDNMSCAHCTARVKKALEEVEGVRKAAVDHESRKAVVDYEADTPAADPENLIRAVEEVGYPARLFSGSGSMKKESEASEKSQSMKTIVLHVDNMSCAHCENRVRAALQSVAGVQNAEVHLESGRADVRAAQGSPAADPENLIHAVEEAGYPAKQIRTASLNLRPLTPGPEKDGAGQPK